MSRINEIKPMTLIGGISTGVLAAASMKSMA